MPDTDDDYTTLFVDGTFLPGSPVGDEQCISVPLFDDLIPESDESFLGLITSSTADIEDDTAVVTIIDDDTFRK